MKKRLLEIKVYDSNGRFIDELIGGKTNETIYQAKYAARQLMNKSKHGPKGLARSKWLKSLKIEVKVLK